MGSTVLEQAGPDQINSSKLLQIRMIFITSLGPNISERLKVGLSQFS